MFVPQQSFPKSIQSHSFATGIEQRTSGLQRQSSYLVMPGQPGAEALARGDVARNLALQAVCNATVQPRALDRVQLVREVLLEEMVRETID